MYTYSCFSRRGSVPDFGGSADNMAHIAYLIFASGDLGFEMGLPENEMATMARLDTAR